MKTCQWHPHGDEDKRTEVGKVNIPLYFSDILTEGYNVCASLFALQNYKALKRGLCFKERFSFSRGKFFPLKVGSCPNNDISVQFFVCPFLCSI